MSDAIDIREKWAINRTKAEAWSAFRKAEHELAYNVRFESASRKRELEAKCLDLHAKWLALASCEVEESELAAIEKAVQE